MTSPLVLWCGSRVEGQWWGGWTDVRLISTDGFCVVDLLAGGTARTGSLCPPPPQKKTIFSTINPVSVETARARA